MNDSGKGGETGEKAIIPSRKGKEKEEGGAFSGKEEGLGSRKKEKEKAAALFLKEKKGGGMNPRAAGKRGGEKGCVRGKKKGGNLSYLERGGRKL